ncbi:hypothetical protein ACFVAJ_18815 [Agromyces sp. NPDC057679]|uniref:hypothetical protein n=1 Tax=Agromyces sp. NPDC057679 TaxID=3346207 RepID=UPI00366D833D
MRSWIQRRRHPEPAPVIIDEPESTPDAATITDLDELRRLARNPANHDALIANPDTPADALRHIWLTGDGPPVGVLEHGNAPFAVIVDARWSTDPEIAAIARTVHRARIGLPPHT